MSHVSTFKFINIMSFVFRIVYFWLKYIRKDRVVRGRLEDDEDEYEYGRISKVIMFCSMNIICRRAF